MKQDTSIEFFRKLHQSLLSSGIKNAFLHEEFILFRRVDVIAPAYLLVSMRSEVSLYRWSVSHEEWKSLASFTIPKPPVEGRFRVGDDPVCKTLWDNIYKYLKVFE